MTRRLAAVATALAEVLRPLDTQQARLLGPLLAARRVAVAQGIASPTADLAAVLPALPGAEDLTADGLGLLSDAVRATLLEADQVLDNLPDDLLTPRLAGDLYPLLIETLSRDGRYHRRTSGMFYTPQGIVDAILDLAGDGGTLCDPAMGSGHFLLAATERVLVRNGLTEARLFATQSLYGVDLDPTAVQLARVALGLLLSRPGELFLPPPGHFLCGDSLCGAGFGASSAPATQTTAVDWRTAFPDVAAAGGFDRIVGNPPYDVLTRFARQPESAAYAKRLRACGQYPLSLRGQINLYRCFIERGLHLLRPGGRLALVVPAGLLRDGTAAPLRHELLTRHGLDEVHLYEESDQLFHGVTQAAVVFRVQRAEHAPAGPQQRATVSAQPRRGRPPRSTIDSGLFSSSSSTLTLPEREDVAGRGQLDERCLRIRQNGQTQSVPVQAILDLGEEAAIPNATPEEWRLLQWLTEHAPRRFADLAEGLVGEVDQTVYRRHMLDHDTGTLLARGTHLQAFKIDLKPREEKERFLDREAFLAQKGRSATTCLARVEQLRIAQLGIRNMQSHPRLLAARLPAGIFAGNSLNIWLPREGVDPHLLLGLLNSALYDWRFCLTSGNNNINLYEVACLPLPPQEEWNSPSAAAVAAAARRCEKAARQRNAAAALAAARSELDAAVLDWFGIPDEMQHIVLNAVPC